MSTFKTIFGSFLDGVFTFYIETKNNWQLTTSLTNEHLHPEYAAACRSCLNKVKKISSATELPKVNRQLGKV